MGILFFLKKKGFGAARLTRSGAAGGGQSQQSFLLQNDASTNQEGREQSQGQPQPQVVAPVGLELWRGGRHTHTLV